MQRSSELHPLSQKMFGLVEGMLRSREGQEVPLSQFRRGMKRQRRAALPQKGHHRDVGPPREIQLRQRPSQAGAMGP